jgi:hypothetical protein
MPCPYEDISATRNCSFLEFERKIHLHTETATNAASHPSAQSGGRRDIIIDTQPRGDTAATVAIASISDQDWYISRTHGVYHIPACPKAASSGERTPDGSGDAAAPPPPYALLLITARGDVIDLGDNRRFPFTITAREIADDLLQDLHDHGIFVCAGPRPSAEELAAAAARRDTYYQRLITEGDTMWARGHSFREISDLHRRAAISLGVEREWAYVPMRMNECPACGEKVKPAVAVCKHCGAILDAEKAAKHGLGTGASSNVGGNAHANASLNANLNAKTRQS